MAATSKIISSALLLLVVYIIAVQSAPSNNSTSKPSHPARPIGGSPKNLRATNVAPAVPANRVNGTKPVGNSRPVRSAVNIKTSNRTSSEIAETSEEDAPTGQQHFQVFRPIHLPVSSAQSDEQDFRSNTHVTANGTKPGSPSAAAGSGHSHLLVGSGVSVN